MNGLSIGWVRKLKGARLSVFMLLAFSSMPVSQQWLECSSGYSDKPVARALAYLLEIGCVVKTAPGWHLSGAAFNILPGLSRKNSESGPIIIINTDSIESEESNNNTKASRKNSDSRSQALWCELRKVGVYRNERTEKMVRLPHVTLEYVRALAGQFAAEKKAGTQWAGLFVQLCERGEPVRVTESVQEKVDRFLQRGARA